MSDKSGIEWTDATWNPVSGCTKVSSGCKHCYAERVWARLSAPNMPYSARPFTDVKCHPDRLDQPLRWRKPRRVFVNSMSDLFHEDVPFEFIASVFAIMGVTTRHTYQILTKRPERMNAFFAWALQVQDEGGQWYPIEPDDFRAGDRIFDHWPNNIPWFGYNNCGPVFPYENIWLGVSVENQKTANERAKLLRSTPAAVRFISVEPLLETVNLYSAWNGGDPSGSSLDGLHWVIVGGESGPNARPMNADWARYIKGQCLAEEIPFFMKQMSKKAPIPDDLMIREYPE